MAACINAIVGGVAIALAVRSLLDASAHAAAVTGGLVALSFAILFMTHQVRRFVRAAAVAPELFAWESSGVVSWSQRMQGKDG